MAADQVFTSFPELVTKRTRLRSLRADDAPGVFAWKSDPQVTDAYGVDSYRDLGQATAWVAHRLRDFQERNGIMWLVADATTDVPLGSICLWHFDEMFQSAELGYELGRPSWGRGLATEAAEAVVRFGFSELRLHRVEACPLAGNTPSIRVLQKVGFTLEGTLRERVRVGDRFVDQLYFGLLGREWRARAQLDAASGASVRHG